MASANEVRVSYIADIRDLTAKLKSVTGITASEVRQQVAAVVAGQKAQAAAMKATAASAKALGDTAGVSGERALKAFGPLGGVLSRISPEAGAAASSVAALTSAAEGFAAAGLTTALGAVAVAAGAVAAAVGVGYLAWRVYNDDAAKAEAVSLAVSTAMSAQAPLLDAVRDSTIRLQVATGQLTDEQAKMLDISQRAADAYAKATEGARKRVHELADAQTSLTTQIIEGVEGIVPAWTPLGAVFRSLTTDSADMQVEMDALNGTIGNAIGLTRTAVEADKAALRITNERKAATSATTDALRAQNEQLARQAALADASINTFRGAESGLAAMEASARASMASKEEALALDRQAAQARADAYLRDATALSLTTSAKEDIEAQYRATNKAEDAAYYAALAELRDADVQKAEDAASKIANAAGDAARASAGQWAGVANATIQAVDTMSAAFANSYDTTTAAGLAAAKRQWRTQHGIAIAMTAALAIVSGAQAAASAPWPENLPAMIASSITSTASIAAVAAVQPTFHQGGLAPDEVMRGGARVQPGEGEVGIVSKQGMSSFRGANAGMRPASTFTTVELKLRHSTMDRVVAENIQRGGMTSAALTSTTTAPYGARRDTWRR